MNSQLVQQQTNSGGWQSNKTWWWQWVVQIWKFGDSKMWRYVELALWQVEHDWWCWRWEEKWWKKFFFFWRGKKNRENVAEKCGEVIEKKLAEKKLVKKISLFLNGNSTNRSKKWYTQVIMELTTSQENKFRFKRGQTSNQWVVERWRQVEKNSYNGKKETQQAENSRKLSWTRTRHLNAMFEWKNARQKRLMNMEYEV